MTFTTVEETRRLPGTWSSEDYRRLLEILEVDDLESYSEQDLESVALMALQDEELDQAASIVLSNFTEGRFSAGQIRNLCQELTEDRAWEEYADLNRQRALYVCVDLLNAAFPFDYPEPSATRVVVTFEAEGLDKLLTKHPLDSASLLRAVSQGVSSKSVIHRFFSDQIAGGEFPEASSVVWHLEESAREADSRTVSFVGSSYWFHDLEEGVVSGVLKWPSD